MALIDARVRGLGVATRGAAFFADDVNVDDDDDDEDADEDANVISGAAATDLPPSDEDSQTALDFSSTRTA